MGFTLQQLAELVQGELEGDGQLEINAAAPLKEARTGSITFLEHDKHANRLASCKASAVVLSATAATHGLPAIRVADPLQSFVAIVRHLQGKIEMPIHGIDPKADVHATVRIGPDASIHAFASVGEGSILGRRCRIYPGAAIGRFCRLGDDVTIYANAVLYEGTVLGDRVILHANSVLGADGFGYRFQGGRHVKVPQLGSVEIGSDVEIGACTTIDRGTFLPTRVGDGTKIDNLVQVAHNCQVGKHNLLVSQVGIAGSTSTGDYVVVAGQAGIIDHVHIGDHCVIGGQSAVTKSTPPGLHLLGSPATPERDQKRIMMSLEKLPEIRRDVQRIKERLGMSDEPRMTG